MTKWISWSDIVGIVPSVSNEQTLRVVGISESRQKRVFNSGILALCKVLVILGKRESHWKLTAWVSLAEDNVDR